MENNIEPRNNFYADEMNYERMEKKLEEVAQDLTLAEVLKMVREICYDMVYYNGEDNCGVIYKDEKYSKKNIEQACQLQRMVSTACDLFGQSIINHREFDDGYLNKWLNGGAMELQIESLKNEIDSLKDQIQDWKDRCYDLECEMREQ